MTDKIKFSVTLFSILGTAVLAVVFSQSSDKQVNRGKYLVHHVAMCVQCHTPRDKEGNLDGDKLLEGGVMPVKSPFPNREWAFSTPTIADLGGYRAEDIVQLLQTGNRPNSLPPRPPMPPFRMSESDARAVVAYLKSL